MAGVDDRSPMGVAVGLIQSNGFFVRCFTVGHATFRRRWPRWCTAAIEQSAREHGRRRAILEAGAGQPEALTLYESVGYHRIENYSYFREWPECRSYARASCEQPSFREP